MLYLIKLGKIDFLRRMLKFNFNLNDNDYINQTPLFYAAK
jgi:hypothetical protein